MRASKVTSLVLFLGVLVAFCQPAMATSITLADLLQPDATIVSGDKIFFEFSGYSSTGVGGAEAVAASDITVAPYYHADRGEHGLIFQSGFWVVDPRQSQDTSFRFKVQSTIGWLITDNTLTMGGVYVNDGASVTIIETVHDADPADPENSLLASKRTRVTGWSGGNIEDHQVFNWPVPVAIVNKDISLVGGSTGGAQISDLTQTFSQVPEPVTMVSAFLAISGLGVYVRKHTRKPVAQV